MIGLSKEQQLSSNRIKPKQESSFGKKRAPIKKKRITTDEELAYLNYLKGQGLSCYVCGTSAGLELHHIKRDSTDKKRHDRVIPLCYNHHHGSELSPHGTPKEFRDIFSMEVQEAYAWSLYEEYKIQEIL